MVWHGESCCPALQRCPPEARAPNAPTTPAMPSKGSVRGDKGAAPSSPTANAASARNTAVAGEVRLSLMYAVANKKLCCPQRRTTPVRGAAAAQICKHA